MARDLRATVVLALPLIGGQVSTMGMSVADVMLAGHLNAHVLGTVAVGTALFNIANIAVIGINAAVAPSVAQLDGARRRDAIGPLFRQAVVIAAVAGLLLMAAEYWGAPLLGGPLGFEPSLSADMGAFLRAAAPAVPALSLFYCCRGFSEGLSRTRPTLAFGLLGLLVLVPVGYVLMYGKLGLPSLGARGSGFATAIACWTELFGFALWLRLSGNYRGLGWHLGARGIDRAAIGRLLQIGLPMAASLLLETSLFSAAGLAIGRFGETAAAGHQVALSVAAFSFMVPLGFAIATTVRVGNASGRGDAAGVRRAGLTGLGLALAVQAVAGALMLTIPQAIAGIYTGKADVVAAAVPLLRIAGVFQLSDGVQVAAMGALRGLKDTRVPLLITAVAYWGIGMPLALWLAFAADLRAPGMWYGLIAGLTAAAGLLTARFLALSRRMATALQAA